jgi:hypothetical protein
MRNDGREAKKPGFLIEIRRLDGRDFLLAKACG